MSRGQPRRFKPTPPVAAGKVTTASQRRKMDAPGRRSWRPGADHSGEAARRSMSQRKASNVQEARSVAREPAVAASRAEPGSKNERTSVARACTARPGCNHVSSAPAESRRMRARPSHQAPSLICQVQGGSVPISPGPAAGEAGIRSRAGNHNRSSAIAASSKATRARSGRK